MQQLLYIKQLFVSVKLIVILMFFNSFIYGAVDNVTLERFEEAEMLFNQIELSDTYKDLIKKVQNLRHREDIGLSYVRRKIVGMKNAAKSNYEKARASEILAKTYVNSNLEQALTIIESAFSLCPSFIWLLIFAGDVSGFNMQDYDKANNYYLSAHEKLIEMERILKSVDKKNLVMEKARKIDKWDAFVRRTKCCLFKSYAKLSTLWEVDHYKAIEYYEKALDICYEREISGICISIAMEYDSINQKSECLRYINLANKGLWQADFNNVLKYYCYTAKVEEDINYKSIIFRKALEYVLGNTHVVNRFHAPVFYTEYANFYREYISESSSEKIFLDGIKYCESIYSYETSQLYKEYAKFLEDNYRLSDAVGYYEKALGHAEKRNSGYCEGLKADLARAKNKWFNYKSDLDRIVDL